MRTTIPYLIVKPGRAGPRHYWQPSAVLRRGGWRLVRLPDDAAAAIAEAQAINARLDAWRAGEAAAPAGRIGTVAWLIGRYREDDAYLDLRARTRRDYDAHLKRIDTWAGDRLAGAITPADVGVLYKTVAAKTPAMAAALIRVLRLLLAHGERINIVPKGANPARGARIKGARTTARIWSRRAIEAVVRAADAAGLPSVGTAVLINGHLGQRQGDVLALGRPRPGASEITVTQSKTGARVTLDLALVPGALERLAAHPPAGPSTCLLVCETTRRPWQADHFRHTFARIRVAAQTAARAADDANLAEELAGLDFMHLRHTAITRLAEAGCSTAEIAAVSGHRLATVEQILERYVVRTRALAASALIKRRTAEQSASGKAEG